MSVDEIYSKVADKMLTGLMVHEQLMNCYLFLGLRGYAKCHEYRYLDETKSYIRLCRYYSNHHLRIIHPTEFRIPDIIPKSWYDSKKEDMDPEMRKTCIKAAFDEWVKWESEVKACYEAAYQDLISAGEVASAIFIGKYVKDVDDELSEASEEKLQKYAISFDIVSIMEEQEGLYKKYKKLISNS